MPQMEAVTLDGSLATYTPNANYFGDDNFTFSVSDGVNHLAQT